MLLTTLLALLTLYNGAPDIEIWVDRDEPVYQAGENLKIFFRVDQDCYVAIYDIEVGGRETLLFPPEQEDGWVEAGHIYELPPENADYDYVISGPEGVETVIALASTEHPPVLDYEEENISRMSLSIHIEEPEPAKLRIVSTPTYARIYLTNVETGEKEYIGRTPRTMVIRPGEYIVKIKKPGFHSLTRRIWLEPGDRRRVFVKLIPY